MNVHTCTPSVVPGTLTSSRDPPPRVKIVFQEFQRAARSHLSLQSPTPEQTPTHRLPRAPHASPALSRAMSPSRTQGPEPHMAKVQIAIEGHKAHKDTSTATPPQHGGRQSRLRFRPQPYPSPARRRS
ncbi:hypothetical protein FA95DRAFT_706992 [Auriscalpium vulgare]|uniref:Uncharacterized protein n=1 Tax=Auriscalpium vulgare TaxID=40419 RepID=A0ACB8S1V0_9AGAM|nr:hypothetical protein FA95DRAFT_706992 [Auriscalpium vulgare]